MHKKLVNVFKNLTNSFLANFLMILPKSEKFTAKKWVQKKCATDKKNF